MPQFFGAATVEGMRNKMEHNIWMTSDLHISHERISELAGRPFDNINDMNEAIVSNWNETVAPEDTVYILGDLCLGKMDDSLPIAGELQGYKILIPGNHDRVSPMYSHKKGYDRWAARYRNEAGICEILDPQVRIDIGHHRKVLVSHFPYSGDSRKEDRFVDYRPVDTGEFLVQGHVHEKWLQKGRQINVGLDAWGGRIVSEDQLAELIDAGPNDIPAIPWK